MLKDKPKSTHMFYMTNKLGAWQVGNNPVKGKVEFKIFIPNGPDPEIKSVQVAGDFQSLISPNTNWDFPGGFALTESIIPEGKIWSYQTTQELDSGFYQYKYFITFNDGSTRKVSDPCTRYSGKDSQNAAFVIGGSQPSDNIILPLAGGRKHLRELNIYELHIDDFTIDFNRGKEAPLFAVIQKLDYIKNMGFNAILFMPWTGWNSTSFSWGYEPIHYFSVGYLFANKEGAPAEKISWLKKLISACHERGIHVIMDGVYNHTGIDFPYKSLYRDVRNCPYSGFYVGSFSGLEDLNFNNDCTNDFIRDVCFYWIDTFKIDGIRFDNTVNFYKAGDTVGLTKLLKVIDDYILSKGENNFSLTIEHLQTDAATVTNNTKATSYWDNAFYEFSFHSIWWKNIDSRLLNALNNQRFLSSPEKVPTLYTSNHDHSQFTFQAGVHENVGSMLWYKTQPYIIALFTGAATPLVQAGNEFGEDHFIPESDQNSGRRVISRPIRWKLSTDPIGQKLSNLYQRLAVIRRDFEGLHSPNFYPQPWDTWQTQFNPQGYGVDTSRQLAIYHRWGHTKTGVLQKFIIVLNFSDTPQSVCVPFPNNGEWVDLLSDLSGNWKPTINNFQLCFETGSNWGHIFFQ